MTALATAFSPSAITTATVLSIPEGPFQAHHEMRCDHGTTEMHTPRSWLSVGEVAVLTMGHQAKTGCACGTRYEAVHRANATRAD